MATIEEKRWRWMDAVRDHSDAVRLSRNSGMPIPNLPDILEKLHTTRTEFFEEYLEVSRAENEIFRKRSIIIFEPRPLEASDGLGGWYIP